MNPKPPRICSARAAGRLDVALPDHGMHLVAYLRDDSPDIAIGAAAQRTGIVVRAISRFYRAARPRPGLMLGFSGISAAADRADGRTACDAHRGRN